MSLLKLNEANFDTTVATGTVLVDFYADWCGPCQMIAPLVAEIAEERTDVTVGKINVDENMGLATRFGIISIPTLLVFKDGKEAGRIVGLRPKDAILRALD